MTPPSATASPALPWSAIQTVLLDMDGTMLDLHFDMVFFQETVPAALAKQRGILLAEAQQFLRATYQEAEGTLAWYDLEHWSRVLGMDILPLKANSAHLIRVHPHTPHFLQTMRAMGKPVHLVTNAHPYSLALKLRLTPIGAYLTSTISSHELGYPKEDPRFWPLLRTRIPFECSSTLLVDDAEPVLLAAKNFGLGYLRHIAAPNSAQPPLPAKQFDSVLDLGKLLTGMTGTLSEK